jgi:high-affinity nickel-transport protein
VLIGALGLHGPVADFLGGLDFGALGYIVVGLFLLAWALSVAIWKLGRFEQHRSPRVGPHVHAHLHSDGGRHTHDHTHWHDR